MHEYLIATHWYKYLTGTYFRRVFNFAFLDCKKIAKLKVRIKILAKFNTHKMTEKKD